MSSTWVRWQGEKAKLYVTKKVVKGNIPRKKTGLQKSKKKSVGKKKRGRREKSDG